jgi:hypothetical protein
LDLGDHLVFEVVVDPRHPTIEAEGMRYEGQRFRTQARLAGKIYGGPFGVDAAFGEPMTAEPDLIRASDFLAFAAVEAAMLPVYPLETHIAEKLHAYTVPRPRPNSRIKDLPDIALLARVRAIEARVLQTAIATTFDHRGTHSVPATLPAPAESWRTPYSRLARRDRLRWRDLEAVVTAARGFLEPVLEPVLEGGGGIWQPEDWRWMER